MNRKLLCSALVVFGGCGTTLNYDVKSPALVGADAKICAKVAEEQGHVKLDLEAENMSPPDRVKPEYNSYVAWYRKDANAQWTRISALEYDDSDREGELHVTVPEVAFDFQVTAEPSPGPVSPSPETIFAQRIADTE